MKTKDCYTREALIKMATAKNIKGRHSMTKEQLCASLKALEKPRAAAVPKAVQTSSKSSMHSFAFKIQANRVTIDSHVEIKELLQEVGCVVAAFLVDSFAEELSRKLIIHVFYSSM